MFHIGSFPLTARNRDKCVHEITSASPNNWDKYIHKIISARKNAEIIFNVLKAQKLISNLLPASRISAFTKSLLQKTAEADF